MKTKVIKYNKITLPNERVPGMVEWLKLWPYIDNRKNQVRVLVVINYPYLITRPMPTEFYFGLIKVWLTTDKNRFTKLIVGRQPKKRGYG